MSHLRNTANASLAAGFKQPNVAGHHSFTVVLELDQRTAVKVDALEFSSKQRSGYSRDIRIDEGDQKIGAEGSKAFAGFWALDGEGNGPHHATRVVPPQSSSDEGGFLFCHTFSRDHRHSIKVLKSHPISIDDQHVSNADGSEHWGQRASAAIGTN
jgi:hypothetical protein